MEYIVLGRKSDGLTVGTMGRAGKMALAGLACLLWTGLCGCGEPRPPGRVNARLDLAERPSPSAESPGDTVVRGTIRSAKRYASRVRGDWEDSWHLVIVDVIEVQRGRWPDRTVSFTCRETWPTIESGIVLDESPPWWMPGSMVVLRLDTTRRPARIVGRFPADCAL